MSVVPGQFLILPDPAFTAEAVESISDNGDGRYAGMATPLSTNSGGMIPIQTGTPDTDTELRYRLIRAGSMYDAAEYIWRRGTETDGDWYGQNDERRFKWNHKPFGAASALYGYGTCALFSTTYKRILLFTWSEVGAVWNIAYRTLSGIGTADPTSWTPTTVTFERAGRTGALNQIAGWELPDGTLQVVVTQGSDTVADLDLYESTDGGLTWLRVARDLLQAWHDGPVDVDRLRASSSGEWIRVAWIDSSGATLSTMASSDRGSSWTKVTNVTPAGGWFDNSETDDAYGGAFDLVGLDSPDGQFLLVSVAATAPTSLSFSFAAGTDAWVSDSDFTQTMVGHKRLCAVKTADTIQVWQTRDDGGTFAGWRAWFINRKDATDSENLREPGSLLPQYGGTQRYSPANICAVEGGGAIVWLWGLLEPESALTLRGDIVCQYMAGWSRRPIHRLEVKGTASAVLWNTAWDAAQGAPGSSSAASTATPFVGAFAGGVTATWTGDKVTMTDTGGAASSGWYQVDQGAAPTSSWAENSLHQWEVDPDASGSQTEDLIACRVISLNNAGDQTDVSIRFQATPSKMIVYDNIASATLYTGDPGVGRLDLRWIQYVSGTYYMGGIQALTVGAVTTWADNPALTLTPGASGLTANQIVRWGHLVPGVTSTTRTSYWYAHNYANNATQGCANFINPTNLRGRIPTPQKVYVDNGVYVRWGGGGALEHDEYDGDIQYLYGTDALFCPSPSLQYRSSTAALSVPIVFDAENVTTSGRWEHDAVGLFGGDVREYVVEYNATNSWGSPSVQRYVSTVAHSGLTVVSLDGAVVEIVQPAAVTQGDLKGMYVREYAGAFAPLEITRQVGAYLHCTGSALTYYVAGTTIEIYSDRAVNVYPQRYKYRFMRVSVGGRYPDTPHSQVRVGRIVPGYTLNLTDYLAHAHSDSEAAPLVEETTRYNLRFRRKTGPARRTFSMSIPGDTSRFREGLRAMVDQLSSYGELPMALVLDESALTISPVLVRFDGEAALENQTWFQIGSRWFPAGAMSLTFSEEV